MTIAVRVEHADFALRDKLLNVGYMTKKGKKEPPVSTLNYGDGVIVPMSYRTRHWFRW